MGQTQCIDLCEQKIESIDHLVSGCPILTPIGVSIIFIFKTNSNE